MNETLQTMWDRRSIRKFKSDPIPEADLNLILEAARKAPTGGNRQNWRMVVVTDAELRKQVATACSGQMWAADAPVFLVLVALPGEGGVNGAIVLDHAILAAHSLGYGTCWIGAGGREGVKGVLGIPDDHTIVAQTPVGVPDQAPDAKPRKAPGELFMAQKWGEALDY